MYNKIIFTNFLKRFKESMSMELELIVPGSCDMGCKYCYHNKYNNTSKKIYSDEEIIYSIDECMNGLENENMIFEKISVFGPENTNLKIKILKHLLKYSNIKNISLPFGERIFDSVENINKFIELQKDYKENNTHLHFSLSLDGKYCENNRPNIIRNNNYYNKVFNFAKEVKAGFHPMIYSDSISEWKNNFLWFIEMFNKNKIGLENLYLLEVRNSNWSDNQIKDYASFLKFIINYTFEKCNYDSDKWINYYITNHLLNLLNVFFLNKKGLGCGLQSTLHVRLGDLEIYPCHRLQRDFFKTGSVKEDGFDVFDGNIELFIYTKICDFRGLPYCESCLIKEMCQGQCFGACQEEFKNIFTPIPQVCKLFHTKISTILNELSSLKILPSLMDIINSNKRNAILNFMEVTNDK